MMREPGLYPLYKRVRPPASLSSDLPSSDTITPTPRIDTHRNSDCSCSIIAGDSHRSVRARRSGTGTCLFRPAIHRSRSPSQQGRGVVCLSEDAPTSALPVFINKSTMNLAVKPCEPAGGALGLVRVLPRVLERDYGGRKRSFRGGSPPEDTQVTSPHVSPGPGGRHRTRVTLWRLWRLCYSGPATFSPGRSLCKRGRSLKPAQRARRWSQCAQDRGADWTATRP